MKVLSCKSNIMYGQIIYSTVSKKKRKRLLTQCMENVKTISDHIEVHDSFAAYRHNYSTYEISIPFNKNLGEKLQKDKDPDFLMQTFLKNYDSLNIFTDGSKIKNNNHVGAACVVPSLNIEMYKSIIKNASV